MSSHSARVFVARLIGLDVFDPGGDRLGRVRDIVLHTRESTAPYAVGFVVEITGKRRIFMPTTRTLSIDDQHVISTGLVNLRRFEKRGTERLIAEELLDRHVNFADGSGSATIEDLALDQQTSGDWHVSKIFVRCTRTTAWRWPNSRGETALVDWQDIENPFTPTPVDEPGVDYDQLPPAGVADTLHHLPDQERVKLALQFHNTRLARVLQELPQDEQVHLLEALEGERAPEVLTEMEPDDAADLLTNLPHARAQALLAQLPPQAAEELGRLLQYDEGTAGALMTPVPVIVSPETTVAEALALLGNEELAATLATVIFVCQPPWETPTGHFLGIVDMQSLLRTPPPERLGTLMDTSAQAIDESTPVGKIAATMALYNLMCVPVLNANGRLVGAVTVDDLLDHLLPANWRSRELGAREPPIALMNTNAEGQMP